jgi:biopolymer transport protein ExbD
MGVSVGDGGGAGGRKSVDVDINLVPFIDMMTVLVAFLLLTAVWSHLAQLNVKPGGTGKDPSDKKPPEDIINLSVLVAQDGIWIGLSNGQPRHIAKQGDNYDWAALGEALQYYKVESGLFKDRDDIEVAAEDRVDYQSVINAMDTAVQKEFLGLRYVDPSSLSVRFKQ